MKYYRYFELFLNIEDQLCDYISQLEYSERSKNILTPKISLLLLQACPIIESYMVQLCTTSNNVKNHELYDWEYNWKLWEHNNKGIKTKGGKRLISNFPKFSYIIEKVCNRSFPDKN